MEGYQQRLKGRGLTLDTDASPNTRLSQRPVTSHSKGSAFEDFGSDFSRGPSKSGESSTSRSTSHSLPSAPKPSNKKSMPIELTSTSGDSSDDEIDFLSGASRHGSMSPKRAWKNKKPRTNGKQDSAPVAVVIDRHQADPNYRTIDLKKMKIPKKSSTIPSMAETPDPCEDPERGCNGVRSTSSSSRPNPLPTATASRSQSEKEMQNRRKDLPLRERSPNQDRSHPQRSRTPSSSTWQTEKSRARKEQDRDIDKTPRPSRPAPRPLRKNARNSLEKSQTVPNLGSLSSQDKDRETSRPIPRSQSIQEFPLRGCSPIHIHDSDSDGVKTDVPRRKAAGKSLSTDTAKSKAKGKGKEKTDPFGSLSPLSSHVAKGKGKKRDDPFDALSPLSSPIQRKRLADFPSISPLSSPASKYSSPSPSRMKVAKMSSQKRRAVISSSEDEEDSPPRVLRPFPMDTRVLASISRTSPFSKRSTPDSGSENEGGAYKKPRRGLEKFALDVDSDSDEDIFLDPSVDPKTLCPWCDEPLPAEPTLQLRTLIATARRVSLPDDRLTNPLGLRAPLAAFVGVCQRHRFERNWVPRARKKGWPMKIDWVKLTGRLVCLKDVLQAIVDDVDEDFVSEPVSGSRSRRRPRKENEFWQEVVKNVRQQGSRQAAGVRGQFLHFNKTQPGYYGEQGFLIIHQTLCELFPLTDFHPDATLPITPSDFVTLVLVPEAAVHLIIEDLSLPRNKAIETLRESVEYGVAMFPADEVEGEVAGGISGSSSNGTKRSKLALCASEQMFMERARVRRKELEEEERREEEEARKARAENSKPKPRPRARSRARGALTDVESAGPTSSPPNDVPGLGAKRKTRAASRCRSPSRDPAARDVIFISSDTGESDVVAPSKRQRASRSSTVKVESDVEIGGLEATPKAKSRPYPHPVPRLASKMRREDDNAHEDPQEALPLASSSSQSTPFVSWNRKGGTTIRRSDRTVTVDAIPKAKVRGFRNSSVAPTSSSPPGGNNTSRLPLQMARERRQREQAGSAAFVSQGKTSQSGEWLFNLRTGNADPTTDDEIPNGPLPAVPSSSIPEPERRKLSRYGDQKQKGSWDWLLSDDSQPHLGSPEPEYGSMY